jgi:crotonobetainyl-CoA:carnitine CoA-transferase CaiB-like acyl-CoA transferase
MLDLLTGCKIVDLTTIVLGPYGTQTLGDMGADVIKVESPDGDLYRAVEPSRTEGMGAVFMGVNRNKRSLCIDLKKPEGKEILLALVKEADVFVHNMRPKAAERLGLTYGDLQALNPKLVYCMSAGYGQDGPYADNPAYDDIIQAVSGAAALNANANGEPRFLPTVAADKVAGLHLALAVLGGLNRRNREGVGCAIEAPMFEAMLSFFYAEHLFGETFRPPIGGVGYNRVLNPYRKPYKTKDGFIAAMPYSSVQWQKFLTIAGKNDLADADWVRSPDSRSRNIDKLYAVIEEVMPQRTSEDWLSALKEADIPCGPVNDLQGLLKDPHLEAVDFFRHEDHPTEGEIVTVRSPFIGTGIETSDDKPVPKKGQQTREILEELGLPSEQVEALLAAGAVYE